MREEFEQIRLGLDRMGVEYLEIDLTRPAFVPNFIPSAQAHINGVAVMWILVAVVCAVSF